MAIRKTAAETDSKLYRSISEVSEMLDVKPHVLRYWETQFSMLRPKKNRANPHVPARRSEAAAAHQGTALRQAFHHRRRQAHAAGRGRGTTRPRSSWASTRPSARCCCSRCARGCATWSRACAGRPRRSAARAKWSSRPGVDPRLETRRFPGGRRAHRLAFVAAADAQHDRGLSGFPRDRPGARRRRVEGRRGPRVLGAESTRVLGDMRRRPDARRTAIDRWITDGFADAHTIAGFPTTLALTSPHPARVPVASFRRSSATSRSFRG